MEKETDVQVVSEVAISDLVGEDGEEAEASGDADLHEPLAMSVKLGYGTGEAGLYGMSSIWGFFLTSFLLEGALLMPTYVAIVTMVGQLADAVSDPLVGKLSDEYSLDAILDYLRPAEEEEKRGTWKGRGYAILVWLHSLRFSFLWAGRRKPFMAAAVVPFCVFFFLLFLVPPLPEAMSYHSSQLTLFCYYFVVFTIVNVTYGVVGVTYTALTPDITDHYDDRTTLTMYRMILGMTASTVSVAMQAILLASLKTTSSTGQEDYRLPYAVNAGIWAVLGGSCIVVTLATVHEKFGGKKTDEAEGGEREADILLAEAEPASEAEMETTLDSSGSRLRARKVDRNSGDETEAEEREEEEEVVVVAVSAHVAPAVTLEPAKGRGLQGMIGELVQSMWETLSNKAFLLIVTCYTCAWVGLNFIQSNLLLYVKYVLQAEDFFLIFTLLIQGFSILSIKPWAYVSKRLGKKRTFYIGGSLFMISGLAFLVLPPGETSLMILLASSVCAGSCVGCMLLMPWSMLPDVVELDELETGKRREGAFYAFFVFFQKVGLGVSLGVSTLLLAFAGYDNHAGDVAGDETVIDPEAALQQPGSVIFALRIMVGLCPMLLMAVSILAVYLFPITKESHAIVVAELTKKRALQSNGSLEETV